jgi:glycosyltransferase involved in cell wall biosynthesis
MYPKATRIVAVSQAIKQSLTRRFRVDPAKITVIPNAIDTQAIRAKLRQRPPSHPFYQGRGPVFICTARFHVLKNHQLLLRSFVLVRRKIPAKLILLGHGDQHDTIRRTIDEMALAPHVAMLDFLPDPFAYVAHARLLLLPSYCEGQPLCVLEALACGVPVVSTRWRGVEELIQHRRTGFICAMNDAAFAHGILATLKLGKKPDFRRHALHFADRYDTAHIAPRHTAFFSSLVPRLKFSP